MDIIVGGEPKKLKKFTIETPGGGKIESDSGNHFVDVGSVFGVVVLLFIVKGLISKYFPWNGGE
tara:strand:- start:26916 stop:27107 length:192 start_codon:yes stop_codon:yes gene_type:complete